MSQEIDIVASITKNISWFVCFICIYILKKLKNLVEFIIPKIVIDRRDAFVNKIIEAIKVLIGESEKKLETKIESVKEEFDTKLEHLEKIKNATHGEKQKTDAVLLMVIDMLQRIEEKIKDK